MPSKPITLVSAAFVFEEGEEEEDLEDETFSSEIDEPRDKASSDLGSKATNEDDHASISGRYTPITKLCFNLVVFDRDNDAVRFAHFSMQDFAEKFGDKHSDPSVNMMAYGSEQSQNDILEILITNGADRFFSNSFDSNL